MKCLVCGRLMTHLYRGLFDDRYGAPGRHSIYRCPRCGFGRIHPGIPSGKLGSFYARHYPLGEMTPQSVRTAIQVKPRWSRWLNGTNNVAHHYIRPGAKVLDVGSGSGVSLLEIERLGGRAYGIEPDPNAGRLAKKLGLRVYTGFLTDNPFSGESFDVITASQVLEHTPDPKRFLREVKQRLAPGGYAVLSFPNFDAPTRRLFGRLWLHWHIPYHYNFFTRQSFEELARAAGLRVKKVRTITPNLWTVLQLRSAFVKPVEGAMSPIWSPQHPPDGSRSKQSLWARAVRALGLFGASFFIAGVNRLSDLLGQGESFLVWVEEDKE